MMRRRKKDSRGHKGPPREERSQQGPALGRRRGRSHVPVPPELQVRAEHLKPTAPAAPAAPAASTRERRRPARDDLVVLVTGFDPFGGEQLNPSWDVCKRLPREIAGHRVETCKVPCEFRASIEVVAEAIERHQPAIVVSLGQAGGRAHLTVERVAINIDDARIDDNSGARPVDEPIAPKGPAGYFATLPIKAMTAAIRKAGVPAHVSNSAGTYVCNHLMYGVLHFIAASGRRVRAGFMHLPYAEAQVLEKPGVPALSLESMARGVEAAIAAACEHREDIKVAEGALD
jgi:pyroglutamyl-peptidase